VAKRRRKTGKKKTIKGWHILALILAASLTLAAIHVGDAFGGFHGATNEAFYAELGRSVAKDPLKYPSYAGGKTDYNIPPLTAYLLGASFMAFGESEASARLVPIIFSLASITLTYMIGRRIYDERTGLAAAAILAFTPMNVIVGRNVQTDPYSWPSDSPEYTYTSKAGSPHPASSSVRHSLRNSPQSYS
jgi:4-amino-4-deoxy-L-arabinose transferase-like glycosyltransferase